MKKIILLAVSSALLSSGLLISTPAISSATVLPSSGVITIPYSGAPDTSYTSPNGTCVFQITAVGGAGGSGSYNGGLGGAVDSADTFLRNFQYQQTQHFHSTLAVVAHKGNG